MKHIVFLAFFLCLLCFDGLGQSRSGDSLFSPMAAELFIRTAYELVADGKPEAAVCFTQAASALERSEIILAEPILRVGIAAPPSAAVADWMQTALSGYLNRQPNLDLALSAMGAMIEPLQSRAEREVFLERMARRYAAAQPILASELLTQWGLLAAEKGDFQTALERFKAAAERHPYNFLAREKYFELANSLGQPLPAEAEWVGLRLLLDIQPYHLASAMRYADGLMQMEMYAEAAAMYGYAEQVFGFLQPAQPLPRSIYLPRLLCLYRAPNQLGRCLELAEQLRRQVSFDLMLEAVAGLAAKSLGQEQQAQQMLLQAAAQAEQLADSAAAGGTRPSILPEDVAWFYAFALRDAEAALAWADKAYRQTPQRPAAKSMFVYALVLNGQPDVAQPILEQITPADPLTVLSRAMIDQAGKPTDAAQLLRSLISAQPASLEAEQARAILKQLNADYLAPIQTQETVKALESLFGGQITPVFLEPQQRLACKVNVSSSELLFGADFDARLIAQNTGKTPLVIQKDAFWSGAVRVDASIGGDIQQDIPALYSVRIRPPRAVLPGEDLIIPLDVNVGALRKVLLANPHASLDIALNVCLDAQTDSQNRSVSALGQAGLASATIKRRAVALNRDFLMQRLDTLARGQEGQKLQTIRLFAGLLAEQLAAQKTPPKYPVAALDRTLLTDALRRALADDSWTVRLFTMDALNAVDIEADYTLLRSLSENLNHPVWPARFMALFTLWRMSGASFAPVLEWHAQNDPNPHCQRLASVLSGRAADGK